MHKGVHYDLTSERMLCYNFILLKTDPLFSLNAAVFKKKNCNSIFIFILSFSLLQVSVHRLLSRLCIQLLPGTFHIIFPICGTGEDLTASLSKKGLQHAVMQDYYLHSSFRQVLLDFVSFENFEGCSVTIREILSM